MTKHAKEMYGVPFSPEPQRMIWSDLLRSVVAKCHYGKMPIRKILEVLEKNFNQITSDAAVRTEVNKMIKKGTYQHYVDLDDSELSMKTRRTRISVAARESPVSGGELRSTLSTFIREKKLNTEIYDLTAIKYGNCSQKFREKLRRDVSYLRKKMGIPLPTADKKSIPLIIHEPAHAANGCKPSLLSDEDIGDILVKILHVTIEQLAVSKEQLASDNKRNHMQEVIIKQMGVSI